MAAAGCGGKQLRLHACTELIFSIVCLPCCRLLNLQEKDRAKFGPEYGDRFCMLQLVGRHEMDKVQLQHESEQSVQKNVSHNGVNGVSAGLNGLNAAALALQALAAANPALLLSQNPWLAQHMQQQLLMHQGAPTGNQLQNPFAANVHAQQQASMPGLEAAQLAAQHLAAGQHLGGAGEGRANATCTFG